MFLNVYNFWDKEKLFNYKKLLKKSQTLIP